MICIAGKLGDSICKHILHIFHLVCALPGVSIANTVKLTTRYFRDKTCYSVFVYAFTSR